MEIRTKLTDVKALIEKTRPKRIAGIVKHRLNVFLFIIPSTPRKLADCANQGLRAWPINLFQPFFSPEEETRVVTALRIHASPADNPLKENDALTSPDLVVAFVEESLHWF